MWRSTVGSCIRLLTGRSKVRILPPQPTRKVRMLSEDQTKDYESRLPVIIERLEKLDTKLAAAMRVVEYAKLALDKRQMPCTFYSPCYACDCLTAIRELEKL